MIKLGRRFMTVLLWIDITVLLVHLFLPFLPLEVFIFLCMATGALSVKVFIMTMIQDVLDLVAKFIQDNM